MLSLKQLKYALAIAQTLHFKKAAELCHISQSALSTALNELEKQLGAQIFERNNKQVLVTPFGEQALQKARDIVLNAEELEYLAAAQSEPLSFPLSIGVIPTICPYLLPKVLPQLKQDYPQAQFTIIEEQSQTLVTMVREGQIDAAILALPYPCDGLLEFDFWEEDFYWVAPNDKHRKKQREVSSEALKHQNLMLLSDGHCLKEHVLEACKLPQQTANNGFGATSLNTLIQMVRGGLGTTLIPAMAIDQLIEKQDELVAVHLDEPSPHRRIAFIVRPNYTRTSSIQALINVCKDALG